MYCDDAVLVLGFCCTGLGVQLVPCPVGLFIVFELETLSIFRINCIGIIRVGLGGN
jgi:hypothetical protein